MSNTPAKKPSLTGCTNARTGFSQFATCSRYLSALGTPHCAHAVGASIASVIHTRNAAKGFRANAA